MTVSSGQIEHSDLLALYCSAMSSWQYSYLFKNLDKATLIFFFFLKNHREFELGFGSL